MAHSESGFHPRAANLSVKDINGVVIEQQPNAASAMRVAQPDDSTGDGAMRLRGGCIPCPVSQNPALTDAILMGWVRREKCATSSLIASKCRW